MSLRFFFFFFFISLPLHCAGFVWRDSVLRATRWLISLSSSFQLRKTMLAALIVWTEVEFTPAAPNWPVWGSCVQVWTNNCWPVDKKHWLRKKKETLIGSGLIMWWRNGIETMMQPISPQARDWKQKLLRATAGFVFKGRRVRRNERRAWGKLLPECLLLQK